MIETLWRPPSFAAHPAKRPAFPRRAICQNIVDGDTIDALIEFGLDLYQYVRVRLAKIDCPEIFHPKSPAELTLGLAAKQAVETVLLNEPIMVDLGSESQVQGRFLATVAFTRDGGATWTDLGAYLTANHLLKSDVVIPLASEHVP